MTSPYAGTPTPPPGAGRREDRDPGRSEHRDGGLLAPGTRVTVTVPLAVSTNRHVEVTGPIVGSGSVPAPYLAIADECSWPTAVVVIFLGAGVIVRPALPEHPGTATAHPGA